MRTQRLQWVALRSTEAIAWIAQVAIRDLIRPRLGTSLPPRAATMAHAALLLICVRFGRSCRGCALSESSSTAGCLSESGRLLGDPPRFGFSSRRAEVITGARRPSIRSLRKRCERVIWVSVNIMIKSAQ